MLCSEQPPRGAGVLRALGTVLYVLAVCVLAYLASAELLALTSLLAYGAGMARADAVMLAAMLGFGYLWLILHWAFSRPRVAGTWMALAALTAASMLAVRWLKVAV